MAQDGNNSIWRHGRKLYLFAAVALAVFVFVLAIGRLRGGHMVATAVLRHELPSGTADNQIMRPVEASGRDLLEVRQSISADTFLAALLTALPAEISAQLEPDRPSPQARIDAVRGRFEFALSEDASGRQPASVAVRFLHEQGAIAREVVNAAAGKFAQQQLQTAEATLYRRPHQEAKQAAAQAKQAWDAAEQAFREFSEENREALDRLHHAAQTPNAATAGTLSTDASAGAYDSAAAATDSGWESVAAQSDGPRLADPNLVGSRYARQQIEQRAREEGLLGEDEATAGGGQSAPTGGSDDLARLDADLADLQSIKLELLSQLTGDHPKVIELNGRIDELSGRLTELRQRVATRQATAPTGGDNERVAAGQPETAAATLSDEARTDLLTRHRRLRGRADLKGEEYRRLAGVERDRWMRQLDERRVPRWKVHEADRATMRHEPTSLAMMLLGLAMGVTAGAGLLMTAGISAPGFTSVEEAEQALPVPVVGRLPGKEPAPEKHRLQRIARGALLLCEIALAGFLVAMIVAVMLDGDFTDTVRKDPLAALSDGWRHLLSLWRG